MPVRVPVVSCSESAKLETRRKRWRQMSRKGSAVRLPKIRGEVSAALIEALGREPGRCSRPDIRLVAGSDPCGDHLQLALYLCYELHFRGFDGVDGTWEWDPELGHRHVCAHHLKEADPHVWVIPRLTGRAKAGTTAVEFDKFGAGRAEQVHSKLFADLMADLNLDTSHGRYLDAGSR